MVDVWFTNIALYVLFISLLCYSEYWSKKFFLKDLVQLLNTYLKLGSSGSTF